MKGCSQVLFFNYFIAAPVESKKFTRLVGNGMKSMWPTLKNVNLSVKC